MAGQRALVMGASGFLGSTVTRLLVERGEEVSVLVRETSNTRAIDDLDIRRHNGGIDDLESIRGAMTEVDVVYYCIVDTRAWLRDPAPLFETNVEGLRRVLDVAIGSDLQRFVFCSTIGAIAIGGPGETVNEDTPFNWAGKGGPYIESRRQAEDLVMDYVRNRGLPAIALNISNTYGAGDWAPTPHGSLVAAAALGKMRFYLKNVGSEVVGIDDAAEAMIAASTKGRVGERYIISESFMSAKEIYGVAAEAGGVPGPKYGVPPVALTVAGVLATLFGKLRRRDYPFSTVSVSLLRQVSPLDHSKATRELGWVPQPTTDSIRAAAQFTIDRRQRRRERKLLEQ
ncbi:NAD-dependent epimerase/dehydratase family protein [Williamsia sp.]|uniref:NAD-dependent epimerase/dehydratase family protein n=1 Tax=Williamsia sp. TaxID=1872085 RepID=UPI002F93DA1D